MRACRIVLVRPQIAANLGATARIMRNMGFDDLVLVAPVADPADRQARQLSTHGEAILDRCRIVADLDAAVADCVLVAATSARSGGLFRKQSAGRPDEVLPKLLEATASGPTALVFGPESTGLTNAEITRCHWLIQIPAMPDYPALNLAQAVAVCLYELHLQASGGCPFPGAGCRGTDVSGSPAPFAELDRAFTHLRMALEEIHFLFDDKADALWHGVRHLLARALPTQMEVELIHGLARQLQWVAERRTGETI